jgi:Transglutaminase-like superfamily
MVRNSFNQQFHRNRVIDTFVLYKRISEQSNDQHTRDSVKQLVPDRVILKLNEGEQELRPILEWFKNDFMKWIPKNLFCKRCNRGMDLQFIEGDSWKLRNTESHICRKCRSNLLFPRYGDILKIAESRIGRCSEWSFLFCAILNSLSIKTRIVHDFLDHCWNEALLDGEWLHIDSTLEYPISFDHPHYYEQNWGKRYGYILAFSADGLDVTTRYTEQWDMVKKRRKGTRDGTSNFTRIYSQL